MQDYSKRTSQSQKAKEKNANHQPAADFDVTKMMNLITQSITKAKALTLLRLLPYLPQKYQTMRALAKILDVSYQTVHNWINLYGYNISKEKGGDKHDKTS